MKFLHKTTLKTSLFLTSLLIFGCGGNSPENAAHRSDSQNLTSPGIFLVLCEGKQASTHEQRKTVEELLQIAKQTQCKEADKILKAKEKLVLERALDISPIKSFVNLKKLTLKAAVGDYSPLKKLSNLRELEITNSNLENLSFLKNMKSLKVLRIVGKTKIKDLSPLANLYDLSEIYGIEGSQIEASGCPSGAVSPGVRKVCAPKSFLESVQADIQKYSASFKSYKKELLNSKEKLLEIRIRSTYERLALHANVPKAILDLKDEVLLIGLLNDSSSSDLSYHRKLLLDKLEVPSNESYSGTLGSYSELFDEGTKTGSLPLAQLIDAVKKTGEYVKTQSDKLHNLSVEVSDHIQQNGERLTRDLGIY